MQIDDFKNYSAPCFRDYPPPCGCACPLGVDIRAVIDKVQRNNFTSAYRLLRNQVLFPLIVSHICHEPCKEVCVRKNKDSSILLKHLERACVAYTRDRDPVEYNVPKKHFTIAVIGAGLSGLSCALKLASRNYTVKVYEKNDRIGGRLWDLLPPALFLPEIELQFSAVEYELFLSQEVQHLDSIEADAFYIATGDTAYSFGLLEERNQDSLGTTQKGVFLGGRMTGCQPVESIENGARASHSIEKYLKVGAMDGVPETFQKKPVHQKFYCIDFLEKKMGVSDTLLLSKEEALDEGKRCLCCNCSECKDNCELMQQFSIYPQRITSDVMATLRPVERFTSRIASRLINSCSLCGVCRSACPEGVDMEECFLEARRFLHKDGALPSAYHDFWLRDMLFSHENAYFVFSPKGANGNVEYLFFPGCQLGASDPQYTLKTYEYLLLHFPLTGVMLGCCGVPADWAGDVALRESVLQKIRNDWEKLGKPTIIVACPTCRKTLHRYFSECQTISLYEHLAKTDIKAPESAGAGNVSVYDPCSSRFDPTMQKSVRTLAAKAGFCLEEISSCLHNAKCCGFGGHIQAVNKKLVDTMVIARIAEGEHEYLTYCTNCRDMFAVSGKHSRHILDVFFTDNSALRRPPSLTKRRENRLALKMFYAEKSGIALPAEEKVNSINIHIPDELVQKMDHFLILEEDVTRTVEYCETTGDKLYDPETKLFTGHHRIGIITYWVTYAKKEKEYTLHNVYTHRLNIESECCG